MGTVTLDFSRAVPISQDTPVTLDFSKAQPIAQDLTANPNGEGTYQMVGKKGPKWIPYSNVPAAQEQGYKLWGGNEARYNKDRAADKSQDDPTQHGFWKSAYENSPLPMVMHPIDTVRNLPNAIGAEASRVGHQVQEAWNTPNNEPIKAIDNTLYSIPFVGAALKHMDEQAAAGNWKGAAGSATGMATSAIAGEGVTRIISKAIDSATPVLGKAALLGKTPEGAMESALKPVPSLSQAHRASAVQGALEEGIPVSKQGLEDLHRLLDKRNAEIAQTLKASGDVRVISPGKAAQNLSSVRSKFATQVNPAADLAAIDSAGDEFLNQFRSQPGGAVRNMSAEEAQAMKQGTYRVLKGKFGEQGSAAVEAQKALARGLKDEIARQFPEVAQLNATESRLLDLQPILERALNRNGNHQIIGIGTPIAGEAAKALTGSAKLGAVAGLLKSVLDNPAVKSRLAIALHKGAKIPYSHALARVTAYSSTLGAVQHSQPQQNPDTTGGAPDQ